MSNKSSKTAASDSSEDDHTETQTASSSSLQSTISSCFRKKLTFKKSSSLPPLTSSSDDEDNKYDEEKLWKAAEEEEELLDFEEDDADNYKRKINVTRQISFQRLPDGTLLSVRDILSGVKLELDPNAIMDDNYHDNKTTEEMQQQKLPTPRPLCIESIYGKPLSSNEIVNRIGNTPTSRISKSGLIYHAHLFSDDTMVIKPRRPTLGIRQCDFLSSLVSIPIRHGDEKQRWFFSGVLNGWPGLGYDCPLEVISITYKPKKHIALKKGKTVLRWWDCNQKKTGKKSSTSSNSLTPTIPPTDILQDKQSIRVTLRTPSWASEGWSMSSPGFLFYFDGQSTVMHGKNVLKYPKLDNLHAKVIHHFHHRYALPGGKRESPKDLLTYHAAILVEWESVDKFSNESSNTHTTLIELALVNGVSGYRGRCNWYHDKNDSTLGSLLYRSFPPEMIIPWRSNMCEIRVYDLPHCPNLSSFQTYLQTYCGPGKRFLDPHFHSSHKVRLSYRTKKDILHYCTNYVQRDKSYIEVSHVGKTNERNCQTFAADFTGFLAGKKGIEPLSTASKALMGYKSRPYLFLYDADMYKDDEADNLGIVNL